MINRRKLRNLVTIQDRIEEQDSDGAINIEWDDFAKVWASIEPLSARDFISAQSEQSKITARITILFRDDIEANMRVIHGNKIYTIEGVLPDKESGREYITLPCSEGIRQ